MKKYGYFLSKVGLIEIVMVQSQLSHIRFVEKQQFINSNDDIVIANCCQQLAMYFDKKLTSFSLPVILHGTPFQELVWSKIATIPYGTTLTYGQIAQKIGFPKAYRAVGSCLNKNPLAIIIPCHRVVSKNNKDIKYRYGAAIKSSLLAQENNAIK